MDRVPLGNWVSLPQIVASLSEATLERVLDGSGHAGSDFRAGWINGLSNTRLFLRHPRTGHAQIDILDIFPSVHAIIHELRTSLGYRTLNQVMINRLEPGGKLSAHRDGPPDDDRWHLPITTNPKAVWWDEYNSTFHMELGHWYGPVPYCGVLHAVANNGDTERTHLVVDFEKRV
jgi:hypothetical protein